MNGVNNTKFCGDLTRKLPSHFRTTSPSACSFVAMAWSAGSAGMPSFLFIAGIFNAIFLVRAIKDVRSKGKPMSGSPSVALLLAAISEWCWVLPCFVQCFVIFSTGNGRNRFGCNVQVASPTQNTPTLYS
jgi:hypothetical protein